MTINNGMNEEEYARFQQISQDLMRINGLVSVEHQAWDDQYIANINAELLIELVTTFNLLYAQVKALNGGQLRMMITGRFLADNPESHRQDFIDIMRRADEMIGRINKLDP